MSTSSARPADLDRFVSASRAMDDELRARLASLRAQYADFQAGTDWGGLDAGSMLAGLDRFVELNGIDAQWVARIAEDFGRAGGEGAISTLPDAAIAASLRAAGLYGPRASITFDDPVAWGFPPTTGYADDPVNTASGNFVELENDLPVSGLAEGLRFARTYNSRSDRTGPFGPSWASWATTGLRPRPDGAHYEGPDGRRAVFPRMGAGYGRVAGVDALVEPLPSGLALRWFGGGSWYFDDAGWLTRTEGGPGTAVALRHEGGRLVELAHEGGKRISLEWSADRIVALACSDGRRVAYQYDDEGRLVGADGGAGVRRYELDEAARIVRVVDADGVVEVDNTYDDQGRVVAQASPFGRRARFHYLPGRVTVTDDDSGGPTNTYVHDPAGRLIGLVDGHGTRLTKSYDDWGDPVAVTERNGATTVREWDDRARLVREIRPDGSWFSFLYDERDRPVEVAASTGALTRYRYHGEERSPAEIVDPEGGVTRLVVGGGLVHRVVDPDGVEVSFEFDADGNVVAATDGEGNRSTVERDAAGRATATVSAVGRRTEFRYDAKGRLVERQDPGGAQWAFEYTAAGRLAAVMDPTGARRETHYGSHGHAAESLDELGRVTSRRYDGFGNLVGVLAPDGAKWELDYDALSRLSAVRDPAGATWLAEHDVVGNLVATVDPVGTRYGATVDPAGRVTALSDGVTSATFDYDALGRAVAHRRPDGTEMAATYDRCGRRTSVTDPLGGVTRYEYTPAGRVARIVSPSGRAVAFEYDRCGRVAVRIDAGGRRWAYRYDAGGSLVEVLRPGGGADRFSYDAAGRVGRWTITGRGPTSYAYDAAGRVVVVSSPRGGTRRFAYDAGGRLTEAVDANGGVTRYSYNDRGWVVEIADPLGGRRRRDYDEVGRVVAEVDPLGRRTTFAYDPAGRLVERLDGAGGRLRWRYDASGRVSNVSAIRAGGDPAGAPTVRIRRDDLGRPVAIDEPDVRHKLRWDRAGRLVERRRGALGVWWRYDADGYRAALGYPDATEATSTYDTAGDLTALHHPVLGTVQLERDPTGRLVGLRTQGVRARWRYQTGNLVGYELDASGANHLTELERDEGGRVVAATVDGTSRRFSYDAGGQLVGVDTRDGRCSFRYDANGRLVEERSPAGRTRYVYDAAGQLAERRAGRVVTRFVYDDAGRRLREEGPDVTTTYAWDDLGRLAGLTRSRLGGDTRHTALGVDALGELAEVNGTPLLWDTADPLSPLCALGTDPVLSHGAPWAVVEDGTPRWLEPAWDATVGAADPWGATGGEPDREPHLGYRGELVVDGLVWLRNRAYDPSTRSFVAPDPLPAPPGVPWGANPYAYAGNDPISSADPLGLRPVTEAELARYRQQIGRNAWERGADFVQDNWEYIAAGAMVVGGVALMATGVGGPAGIALMAGASGLVSAGASVAVQKFTTGDVNWGQVAVAGAVGAAAGGAGAGAGLWAGNASRLAALNPALRGAVIQGGDNLLSGMVSRGLGEGNVLDPKAMAGDLLIGGGSGAAGGQLGALSRRNGSGTVFSGHGSYDPVHGVMTVPEGSSLTTYAPHGASISDRLGNAIETGEGLERAPMRQTFRAGEQIQDYTLHPPDGLNVVGSPITVTGPTQLSDLLQPNMGACHWAACLSEAGHPLENLTIDLLP